MLPAFECRCQLHENTRFMNHDQDVQYCPASRDATRHPFQASAIQPGQEKLTAELLHAIGIIPPAYARARYTRCNVAAAAWWDQDIVLLHMRDSISAPRVTRKMLLFPVLLLVMETKAEDADDCNTALCIAYLGGLPNVDAQVLLQSCLDLL